MALLLTMVLIALVTTPLLMARVLLLGLEAAFLIGLLVKSRDKILEGTDEVDAEITLGLMGLLDGFRDILYGSCQALKRGMDALEAGCDSFQEFGCLQVVFGRAHGEWGEVFLGKNQEVSTEWAQDSGWLASDLWGR